MGITSFRNSSQSAFIDCVIELPQLIDELDPPDLCALCQVNRALNSAVDHPAVWRSQFAKMVGVRPRDLPDPGEHAPTLRKPFKLLCRGIDTARRVAGSGREPTYHETTAIGMVHGYLHHYFPEASSRLSEIMGQLQKLEAQGRLPKYFWQEIASSSALTCVSTGSSVLYRQVILRLPAEVVRPTTIKMAKMGKILRAKGTIINLYAVLGIGMLSSLLGAGFGIYITADTLMLAKRHYETRKQRMRQLRISDLVAERRAV